MSNHTTHTNFKLNPAPKLNGLQLFLIVLGVLVFLAVIALTLADVLRLI